MAPGLHRNVLTSLSHLSIVLLQWLPSLSLSSRASPVGHVDDRTVGHPAPVSVDTGTNEEGEVDSPKEPCDGNNSPENALASLQAIVVAILIVVVASLVVSSSVVIAGAAASVAVVIIRGDPWGYGREQTSNDSTGEPNDEENTDVCAGRDAYVGCADPACDELSAGPEQTHDRHDDNVESHICQVAVVHVAVVAPFEKAEGECDVDDGEEDAYSVQNEESHTPFLGLFGTDTALGSRLPASRWRRSSTAGRSVWLDGLAVGLGVLAEVVGVLGLLMRLRAVVGLRMFFLDRSRRCGSRCDVLCHRGVGDRRCLSTLRRRGRHVEAVVRYREVGRVYYGCPFWQVGDRRLDSWPKKPRSDYCRSSE